MESKIFRPIWDVLSDISNIMNMKECNTLEEAMNFFLNNSSGSCIVIKGDESKIVNCYPDAVNFFESVENNLE